MKYWQPKYETMNPEELKKLQLKRLQQSVKLVYDNAPFYRQKFNEAGITPDDIKKLEDVRKLPFTKKTDLEITIFSGSLLPNKKISYVFTLLQGQAENPQLSGILQRILKPGRT